MIKLIYGNCFDHMRRIGDQEIDCIITSPPYNMNLRIMKGRYCSRQITKELTTKYSHYPDNLTMEQYEAFLGKLFRECIRVSKLTFLNIQILTGNKRAVYKTIGKFADNIKEMIIWDKTMAQPAIRDSVLNSQFELVLVLSPPDDAMGRRFIDGSFDRGTLNNLWEIKRGKKASKSHGASFPEELVEKILENFTRDGEMILDPMMGTGTTGVVCERMGRSFIGMELDIDYFNFAEERLKWKDRK